MSSESEKNQESGQVSEVASHKSAGQVTPGDAVAGHPADDTVQEGSAGPDALTGDEDPDAVAHRPKDPDPEAIVDEEDRDPEAIVDEADTADLVDDDDGAYPRVQDVEEDRA
ncbi:hypothetical protein [Nocardioides sp. J54]|uniref:hypothetical protein n=1 Tax=Nocardioides sp. J54 TaxID=935866 RepID=UPI00048BD676|nr:hypothetical protein [Nocardioides sp. J54]